MVIPHQTHEIPEWIHDELLTSVRKTVTFLNELTTEREEPGSAPRAAMPKTAFKHVKALAFCFRNKWGFLGGLIKEFGFVTRKLIAEDGTVSWSAPLFTKGFALSFGITIGYSKCGICLALMNENAVHAALGMNFDCGLSADFLVDMNGATLRKAMLDSTHIDDNVVTDRQGGMVAKYFRLSAMMVDASIRSGRFGPWKKVNTALYGSNYNALDVLNGNFPRPPEFLPIYEILAKYTAASAGRSLVKTNSSKGSTFRLDRSIRSGTHNRSASPVKTVTFPDSVAASGPGPSAGSAEIN